jgi:peptidylprolyl isomerase
MKKIFTVTFLIIFTLLTRTTTAQTQVTFYTSMGTFVVETYDTLMPITAGNFLDLVTANFYDHVLFHRVVHNFVIQGGDPTGTGSGGPGYTIPDEFSPFTSNIQKTLGMANSGPNTGGSQFFINLVNNTFLNPNYPCFGIVISDFNVVQAIGAVAVNANDRPLVNVYMDSLRVTYWSPAAINEHPDPALNLSIFPNPVTEESHISINIKTQKTVNISIYNQEGVELYKGQKELVNGFNNISFKDILHKNFAPGMYVLIVRDGLKVSREKFIVVR